MNERNTTTIRYAERNTRTPFLYAFGIVFSLFTGILFSFDAVPETRVHAEPTLTTPVAPVAEVAPLAPIKIVREVPIPTRIRIDTIGVDASIVTPQSTSIEVLDRALLSGAVHYPGSALSGESGNMLIFGHSSYLPVVKNKAFQAFNELGKLKRGAVVDVFSETHHYTYVVDTVTLTLAENAVVPLTASEPTLTLATCNTFGAKQERWVITAHLTGKTPR